METPKERVICRDLGVMDYAGCWELQKQLFNDLLASKSGDGRKAEQYLLLCEHPPVYTLAKAAMKRTCSWPKISSKAKVHRSTA